MWLVLCSTNDTSALWAYHGLRQLGVAPLELVTGESLSIGCKWEHRLDRGDIQFKLTLSDGRVLCSSRIRGALNRLFGPPPEVSQCAVPSDRDYAQAEWFAFYASWLNGLPGVVINRPTALCLGGPWYHASEWVFRASRSGFNTPNYRLSGHARPEDGYASLAPAGASTAIVIVLRGRVFGAALPDDVVRACSNLADDVRTGLLGITLYLGSDGHWIFAGATASPDLMIGGLPFLRCLAEAFTKGEPS